MNRWPAVVLISAATIVFFAFLVHFGWRTRYGPAEKVPVEPYRELAVPYADRVLELELDELRGGFWQGKPAVALPLVQQATFLPWAKVETPEARVQAFHNGREIYFRVEWDSEGPNREQEPGRFADACAVGIPVAEDAPPESILMGFASMMNFWHWKADADAEFWDGKAPGRTAYSDHYYPFDEEEVLSVSRPEMVSAAEDLVATRPGSLTRKEHQKVQARGVWADGTWSVVFKRSLRTDDPEQDAQFAGNSRAVSFAVWEGERGERGGRKSISDWVMLKLEPSPTSRGAGGPAAGPDCGTAACGTAAPGCAGATVCGTAVCGTAAPGCAPLEAEQAFHLENDGSVKSRRGVLMFPVAGLRPAAQPGAAVPQNGISPAPHLREHGIRLSDSRVPAIRTAGLGAANGDSREPRLIEIRARRFEYEPSRITVQKGDVITIRLDSMDVEHGLYLDGYGLDVRATPGRAARATFVADKTGRFSFRCSVTCGEFHPYMIGFLTVEPNTRFRAFLVAAVVAFLILAGGVFAAQGRSSAAEAPQEPQTNADE